MSFEHDASVIEKVKLVPPKKYNVLAMNNDITSYDEVVYIISKAFSIPEGEAFKIARVVDMEGRAKCNKKPLSKNLADMQLQIINSIKLDLIRKIPSRAQAIGLLKFTLKED